MLKSDLLSAAMTANAKACREFIGQSEWDHQDLLTELARQVGSELGETDGVLVFDPSAFPKQGTESVGVHRQWCGRLGKIENCQVAGDLPGLCVASGPRLGRFSALPAEGVGLTESGGGRKLVCRRISASVRGTNLACWRCVG